MMNSSFFSSDANEDANDYSWHIELRGLSPRWYVRWDYDSLWESLKEAFGKEPDEEYCRSRHTYKR